MSRLSLCYVNEFGDEMSVNMTTKKELTRTDIMDWIEDTALPGLGFASPSEDSTNDH